MVVQDSGVYEGRWFIGWKRQCKRSAVSGDFCRAHSGLFVVRFDREKHQFAPGLYMSQREVRP